MDPPGETLAVPGGEARAPGSPLSRSPSQVESLSARKSTRTRPAEHLEQQNASAQRAPLNPSRPPELQHKSSKMSLFNLFSKPKVERLRGHMEPGLASSRSAMDLRTARKEAAAREHEAMNDAIRSRPLLTKSVTPKPSRVGLKETPPPLPSQKEGKPAEPVPLFQIWPQAIKHGVFEFATITPELLAQQTRSRRNTALHQVSSGEPSARSSMDGGEHGESTRPKMLLKHNSRTSLAGAVLPKKLFILTTSGCVLQYAESGMSDRTPEKILQLGKASAAFACDLIPGKHHVLEVLQSAANELGGPASGSTSLLSKLGLRSAAAKRQASNFLLVMPDGESMSVWMKAVRKQIESQGGRRARPDSVTKRPKTANGEGSKVDIQKTPSQSHRYQVRRDPSRVSLIGPSPGEQSQRPLASPPREIIPVMRPGSSSRPATAVAEMPQPEDEANARTHEHGDGGSVSSISTTSMDQDQLDRLRESTRISHTSTATTQATSRASSFTSSPPTEYPLVGLEDGLAKAPYRMSSYMAKRMSVLPSPIEQPQTASRKPAPLPLGQTHRADVEKPIDSPVLGYSAETSPQRRISIMQSAPDLRAIAEARERELRNSQMPPPFVTAAMGNRPLSFIGELPSPTMWAPKLSPAQRTSTIMTAQPAPDRSGAISPVGPRRSSLIGIDSLRAKRNSSHSFSLPLKVNPADAPSSKVMNRSLRTEEDADLVSPIAAVHTLTAKVDLATQTTIPAGHIPRRMSSYGGAPASPEAAKYASASTRLSLFPSPLPSSPPQQRPHDRLHRSPSASALLTLSQPQTQGMSATPPALRRPSSMQIRSNPAPFLANVRPGSQSSPEQQAGAPIRQSLPPPTRGLRPLRTSVILSSSSSGSPISQTGSTMPAESHPRRESLLYNPTSGLPPASAPRRESLLYDPQTGLPPLSAPRHGSVRYSGAVVPPSRRESLRYSSSMLPLVGVPSSRRESLLGSRAPSSSYSSPNLLALAQAHAQVVAAQYAPPGAAASPVSPADAIAASPLLAQSAAPSRRTSRAGPRGSALPELDFGLPVVGLGPPAPPPSAPLPQIPPLATQSPGKPRLSPALATAGFVPGTSVGSVSDASSPSVSSTASPATPLSPPSMQMPVAGLGIQVGGL